MATAEEALEVHPQTNGPLCLLLCLLGYSNNDLLQLCSGHQRSETGNATTHLALLYSHECPLLLLLLLLLKDLESIKKDAVFQFLLSHCHCTATSAKNVDILDYTTLACLSHRQL